MKRVGLLLVGFLFLSVSIIAGEVITNDSGKDATGLRVSFSTPVLITDFGDILTSVDPQMLSYEFLFSGGTVKPWDSHWFNYIPATATVMSVEWLTSEATSVSLTPNWHSEYEDIVGKAFERSSSAGTGGQALILNLGVHSQNLQMRHTTFLELLRRNTGNELEAVRNPEAIIGPIDTLHHGWGNEITVYVGSEYNGTSQWVEEVIDEVNTGLSSPLFRKVRTAGAFWRFDYSAVDYRNERDIRTDITLSPDGNPVGCLFSVSGLFVYEDDFKTRLRDAAIKAILLYRDYDSGLVHQLGYDSVNFKITRFSEDFFNILSVIRELPNGRDFSQDFNEVNRSPIAKIAETIPAFVGEEVQLDASSSHDPDGLIVSYLWRQVVSSKTDLQYRTNHTAALALTSTAATSFTPNWPGTYCFLLTVVDDAGASSELEVSVEATFRKPPFTIEGISTFAYWDRTGLSTYVPDRLDDFVSERGAEWIEFSPYWWMTTKTSSEVHPLGDGGASSAGFTIRDADLVTLIALCHSQGLKVFLRPTLEFHNWTEWRGGLQPANWQAWFDSYTEFILHYAEIAERTGVEMFTVGVELKNSNGFTDNWRSIIRQVRAVYHGLLTYSDSELLAGLSKIEFWDDLDLISCSGYTAITGSGPYWDTGIAPADDPRFSDFVTSIDRAYTQYVLPAHERYGKPVLVAEAGCANYDGANLCPWCWESIADTAQDNNEQVMYFEALLQVLSSKDWIEGVFPFVWAFKADYNWQHEDWPISHELRLGPVADVVRLWYADTE
jgi:hypothetical protein